MTTFKDLLQIVLDTNEVDFLLKYKSSFNDYANKILKKDISPNDENIKYFLELCLDYYTYSTTGDVLIPDSTYDVCMQYYKSGGNSTIVFANSINGKKWNLIKHKIPGVVGTLDKVYNYQELKRYLDKHPSIYRYILAPKYDGISCAIEVVNGKIVSASTRYDGVMGQDITELIKRASNSISFVFNEHQTAFYKCELCVSTENYNELSTIRHYANRRSATSAIVSTPTNIEYAKYITIIPLLVYHPDTKEIEYVAPYQEHIQFYTPADIMEDIEKYLEKIRTKDFPFRVDGVVLFPNPGEEWIPNESDLMDQSIAYKVNTAENKTKIDYGYMSVGRLGKAIPMLHVEPVEVNETVVTDVSLGSWEKFISMGLCEDEEVIVFSAGDVIPQVRLPEMRINFDITRPLKIKKRCPYCNEKLERVNSEYFCLNQKCPRIITGKISNFLIKLGIEGFSDKTVELIYNGLGIKTIHDFLNLTIDDIKKVDGFEIVSATSLYNELQRIKSTTISIPKFFGALGIDKISEKKCRRIFEIINLKDLLKKKKFEDNYWTLQTADGIGQKTAKVFMDFIRNNYELISELMEDMKLGEDIKYNGNVVFTGLRPSNEIVNLLHHYNLEEGTSVTRETVCVVAASLERESTKLKMAVKRHIPVVTLDELENFLIEYDQENCDF